MPWNQSDQVNERVKFVAAVQAGTESIADVCRRFGISRKTGYKYLHRYEEDGAAGLYDRTSAPGNHPNRTPPDVEEEILRVRKARPTWGSKKIVTVLARTRPAFEVPARSTVDAILSRNGLVERRRSRQRGPSRSAPVAVAEHPNDGWSIDYKGWFRVGDGTRCDPLTLNDVATRMSLKLRALVRPRSENVRAVLTAAFREYGLPLWVLSDNGAPFGSTGIGGLTRLSVWFAKLGITPIFIQPGHPEQNGRHERFHLTLQRETASPPSATIRGQQVKFNRFQRYYNEERPHEALSMAVPASVYVPGVVLALSAGSNIRAAGSMGARRRWDRSRRDETGPRSAIVGVDEPNGDGGSPCRTQSCARSPNPARPSRGQFGP